MFVPAFNNGNWFWLTGSLNGDLAMDPDLPGVSTEEWLHYWDAFKVALLQLVEEKFVRGVFWTEELAVNSILPTRVLPHVHCIIEADAVGVDELRKLTETVEAQLTRHFGPDYLKPDLAAEPIETARSLMDRIAYMVKPFNMLTAYERGWVRACPNGRRSAVRFNSQATDLLLGYTQATTRRQKISFKGNLDSKAKGYIGVPMDELADHRDELKELRANTQGPYIEDGADDDEPDLQEN